MSDTLKRRVYTAIVLAIAFAATLWLPPLIRALVLAVPSVVGFWEFLVLCAIPRKFVIALVTVMIVVMIFVATFYMGLPTVWLNSVLSLAAALWAVILLWVIGYPGSAKVWGGQGFKVLQATFLLFSAWLALCSLSFHPSAIWHLLFIVALVATADIGAYFSGRFFGRHKLAANVSPGKTWEGAVGGVSFAMILAAITAVFGGSFVFLPAISFVVLAAFCVCFSIVGDLYESMIKRQVNAKDSGFILPGHGGVLDRIDGLLPASTLYAFALLQVGV